MKQSKDVSPKIPNSLDDYYRIHHVSLITMHSRTLLQLIQPLLELLPADEIVAAERLLNPIALPQTNVVEAAQQMVNDGIVGSNDVKPRRELIHYVALIRLLTNKIQNVLEQLSDDKHIADEQQIYLAWAQTMAEEAYLAAFAANSELLFPGKSEDVRKLCEMHLGIIGQSILGPNGAWVMGNILDEMFADSDASRLAETPFVNFEQILKSEAGRRAGSSARTPSAQKLAAIRLYEEKNWVSVRKAAQAIVIPIVKMEENRLSPDRAEQTVYEWLLAHEKEKKSKI